MKIVLGLLLIVAAIGLLIVTIVVPVLPGTADNPEIDRLMAQFLCKPGETLNREQYTTQDSDGTGYSANVYCVNNERQQRDETGKWIVISIITFLVPLFASIFLLISGSKQIALKARQAAFSTASVSTPIPGVTVTQFSGSTGGSSPIEGLEINEGSIKFGGMEIRTDRLTAERVQSLRQQMQTVMENGAGGDNLASKLRQLQEARDAGLITGEEYERLRQEVLDNLT